MKFVEKFACSDWTETSSTCFLAFFLTKNRGQSYRFRISLEIALSRGQQQFSRIYSFYFFQSCSNVILHILQKLDSSAFPFFGLFHSSAKKLLSTKERLARERRDGKAGFLMINIMKLESHLTDFPLLSHTPVLHKLNTLALGQATLPLGLFSDSLSLYLLLHESTKVKT